MILKCWGLSPLFHIINSRMVQLDAKTHTYTLWSRAAYTPDNMEQQKSNCHCTLSVSLIQKFKSKLNCYIKMEAIFFVKVNELRSNDISIAFQTITVFYSNVSFVLLLRRHICVRRALDLKNLV